MDLRFRAVPATSAEHAALDALGLPRADTDERTIGGTHAARAQRHLLLPALHALNDRVGWISEGGLDEICRRLTIPPAEAYGVATFYGLFSLTERPARAVWLCEDVACQMAGVPHVAEGVDVRPSPCLGVCERAPAALVVEAGESPGAQMLAPVTGAMIAAARSGAVVVGTADASGGVGVSGAVGTADASGGVGVSGVVGAPAVSGVVGVTDGGYAEPVASVPQAGEPGLVLLARIGRTDPGSIDAYRAAGGFTALRRARELGPVGVLREITDARLLGRGGAAFPAGRKWEAVARQPVRPHYLVCNADESEPGTFKDRVLMEGDPFAVVESIVIAAEVTGCAKTYIYLRGEYPLARRRLEAAIAQVRARGLDGGVDIEVFRGAGAYICGEETAIFNSIEGYRGEPRSKPPFPVDAGLFGAPTLVNNVETLVNVLPILHSGGVAYARRGTEGSTGTKLFCVSGAAGRPGVYEVPFGTSLRELLIRAGTDTAGVRAVLLGGAAGSFVGPGGLDLSLSFEAARAAGTTLGSGVVMVLDHATDVGAFVRRLAVFFRDESCGQCVPCRVGTVRQEEALGRLGRGRPLGSVADEHARLADLAQVMRDASICGLGQTAASAVQSALTLFGPAALQGDA